MPGPVLCSAVWRLSRVRTTCIICAIYWVCVIFFALILRMMNVKITISTTTNNSVYPLLMLVFTMPGRNYRSKQLFRSSSRWTVVQAAPTFKFSAYSSSSSVILARPAAYSSSALETPITFGNTAAISLPNLGAASDDVRSEPLSFNRRLLHIDRLDHECGSYLMEDKGKLQLAYDQYRKRSWSWWRPASEIWTGT